MTPGSLMNDNINNGVYRKNHNNQCGTALDTLSENELHMVRLQFAVSCSDGPLRCADHNLDPRILMYADNKTQVDAIVDQCMIEDLTIEQIASQYPSCKDVIRQIILNRPENRLVRKKEEQKRKASNLLQPIHQHIKHNKQVFAVNLIGHCNDRPIMELFKEKLSAYVPYVSPDDPVRQRHIWTRQRHVEITREKLIREVPDTEAVKQYLKKSIRDGALFLIYYTELVATALGRHGAVFKDGGNLKWILSRLERNIRDGQTCRLLVVKEEERLKLPQWLENGASQIWSL